MRMGSIGLVACLLLSGCSMSDVNEVALFDYERGDPAGKVALKTLGNVTAGALALPLVVCWAVVAGTVQSGGRISGGISGGRITVTSP